jgi:hypothetical protein
MVKTVVIPSNNTLILPIPNNYVGKEIEVFMYAKDELLEEKTLEGDSMKRFRGILSSDEADELQEYVKKSREGWD